VGPNRSHSSPIRSWAGPDRVLSEFWASPDQVLGGS
jgi:hypothetical protein